MYFLAIFSYSVLSLLNKLKVKHTRTHTHAHTRTHTHAHTHAHTHTHKHTHTRIIPYNNPPQELSIHHDSLSVMPPAMAPSDKVADFCLALF